MKANIDIQLIRNRIIYSMCLIAACIYVSFYGGVVPYTLVFAILILPVVSLVYTFFVYMGLKIYQDISERNVVKNEFYDFELCISNEFPCSIGRFKLHYLDRCSSVENLSDTREYSLKPFEQIKIRSRLQCKYRGTYCVGIDYIEIWDFFNLIKVNYPYRMKTKLTVKPAIVKLENDSLLQIERDAKTISSFSHDHAVQLGSETKKYMKGDMVNQIHWKNSARAGELLVRKTEPDYRENVCIIMNSSIIEGEEETKIEAYDKIIEQVISIADYFVTLKRGVSVIIKSGRKYKLIDISSYTELEEFCNEMAEYRFSDDFSKEEAEEYALSHFGNGKIYFVK